MSFAMIHKQYIFLVLLIFCCDLMGSKKISSRDSSSSRLSECRRCKILTDSFNHWLEKTSRGKYEGGDAAWEETKLKSYSRSEVRLVEIQEGLCSDLQTHQDQCYTIAEETEQVLEKWWFHEDPTTTDLYAWLCIENLQHCCPVSHFGEACTPCLKDMYNKVCSGHGRCDGDGSRKGNGACVCKKGYTGTLCNECAQNFYSTESGLCELCHESCNGCMGDGVDSCLECNSGWHLKSGMCVDINECSDSVCKINEFCINTKGSYRCKECDLSCKTCTGEGSSNCISCEDKYVLWFGYCIDNELKQNIITSTFKRLSLYIGFLVMALFIVRFSKSLASIVVLVIAIYIYFSEKHLQFSTKDILLQQFQNLH